MVAPFFGQNKSENSNSSFSEIPEAPPGLAEITIRTMASDIESLRESGGGLPQSKKLEIPVSLRKKPGEEKIEEKPAAAPQKEAASFTPEGAVGTPEEAVGSPEMPVVSPKKFRAARWGIVGIFTAAVLFIIGYYLIPLIFPPKPITHEIIPQITSSSVVVPEAPSSHSSFLRVPADETFTLLLRTTLATSAPQAYKQELISLLGLGRATSTFFEIILQDSLGQPVSWGQFLTSMNISAARTEFWDTNFVRDFTVYVYKDKNGFWPGYIVQLKNNITPLLLQSDLVKLESDPAVLRNFFISPLGEQSGEFKDAQISGQPIRLLQFSTAGASFSYGWFFNKYLIISTSLDGMRQAMQRL
jgi:hypothetical protein